MYNPIPHAAAIVVASARDPSPSIAPYPISLVSFKFLTCFEVVPELTRP